MLYSIKLVNFGPWENFESDFKSGITLVIGKNGKGKSHIARGIGWAVVGSKALDRNQQEYVNDNAKFMSALLEIDLLGKRHQFYRKLQGSVVTASVSREGEEQATGAAGVQEYLDDLGFDTDAMTVLCAMQDQLTDIINATPTKRATLFDSLLRTEDIKLAHKFALDQSKAHDMPDLLQDAGLRSRLVQSLAVEEANVVSSEASVSAVGVLLEQKKTQVQKLREGLLESSNPEQLALLNTNADELESKIAALETEAAVLMVSTGQRSSVVIEDLEKSLPVAQARANELSDLRDEAVELAAFIEREIVYEKGRIDALVALEEDLPGDCPLCGATNAVSCFDSHTDTLEKHQEALLVATEQRQMATQKYVIAAVAFQDMDQELQTQVDAETAIGLLTVNLTARDDLHEDLGKVIGKIEHLEVVSTTKDVVTMLERCEREQDELSESFTDVQKRHDINLIDRNRYEEQLKQYDLIEAEWRVQSVEADVWKLVAGHLRKFHEQVTRNALQWVSSRSSQILQSIGTLPDVQENSSLELDNKLEFWLNSDGGKIPIRRFSGGQKSAFSICLRMALSDFFSDRLGLRGLLILDAVFESMDQENREATAIALAASGPQQAIIFMYEDVPAMEAERLFL